MIEKTINWKIFNLDCFVVLQTCDRADYFAEKVKHKVFLLKDEFNLFNAF